MSTYQTDDEQVEAIKKWWKENGRSVIGGVVLGFGIIGGWHMWNTHQQHQGESASMMYETMHLAVRDGDQDKALEDGKRLIGEYSGSAYAAFAALELAKQAYQRGEKSVARGHLEWVAGAAPDDALRELARLRLGRLLLDIEEFDSIEALLGEARLPAFSGEFAVLRGDLEFARGNVDGARAAYRDAMNKGVADQALLRMKLVDVGGDPAAS